MKTSLLTAVAVLALSSLSVAYAAPQVLGEPNGDSVQIKAAHNGYHMMQEDFRDFRNAYQLQNGQVVTFSQRGAHYFSQLDDGGKVEIFPAAQGVFLTGAGVRVEFRDSGDTVAIANFERLPLAKADGKAGVVMVASR